jgi:hypothetical protein
LPDELLDWVNNLYKQYREWGLPEHRNTYLVDRQGSEMVKKQFGAVDRVHITQSMDQISMKTPNLKCRLFLKKLPVKVLGGRCLSV